MKNIVINGKSITIKPINFDAICNLEEMGLDLLNINKKAFSTFRCLMAFNANIPLTEASVEIESHIANGGNITDLVPLVNAVVESDFFKTLIARQEGNNQLA